MSAAHIPIQEEADSPTFAIDLGICSLGNPGYSAWAASFVTPDGTLFEREGVHTDVTAPHITLRGVLAILLELPTNAEAVIRIRDKNAVEGLTERLDRWEASGWRQANKKPIANVDLWMRIAGARRERPGVSFEWAEIPGSHGTRMEIRAGQLAKSVKRRGR